MSVCLLAPPCPVRPTPPYTLCSRSHISNNAEDGLAGFDMGQQEADNYFKQVRVY